MNWKLSRLAAAASILAASSAWAGDPFFFSTGDPDGRIGTASRPDVPSGAEVESADDFVLGQATTITSATFTGLLAATTGLPTVGEVTVEIYRVFPLDSNVGRTSGPPTFSTPQVPTRVNSPSDAAFMARDSSAVGELTFSTLVLSASFMAANSVAAAGIHPIPGQHSGGNGPVTGQEVQFTVSFTDPLVLPADHYFFVPQVQVTGGDFYWLSTPRPITPPGTPFPSGPTDLQSWIRDAALDPDWLRIGTDITGQGPFNAAFSLTGTVASVPEPQIGTSLLLGLAAVGAFVRRRRGAGPRR
ncbi:MAG TPA: PEP-CTERM sorting domain-containing protein [Caldimonas sp.]|nr:PEP-CTERM sorting domain-containing protein [Caldimonas sp.]HEX4232997.1 PEP-CTERM sorting domain-containing protein [Caldimonas sp.]